MDDSDRRRFSEAFVFAVDAHKGQTRKGRETPYTSHLAQVAGLVLEYGGTPDQAIAGLLHDVLEDCPDVDAEALRERFGTAVTAIVECCTDLVPGDRPARKSPWIERKRRYLLRIEAADANTRLVVACDKLHNLRSVVSDLRHEGTETLERFNASAPQTRWYYESVRRALGEDLPTPLLHEMDSLLTELAAFVPVAAAEG